MTVRPRSIALGLGIGLALAVLITSDRAMGAPVDAQCYYDVDRASPGYPAAASSTARRSSSVMERHPGPDAVRRLHLPAPGGGDGRPHRGRRTSRRVRPVHPGRRDRAQCGNINLLIVGAVLIGFRYPWAWAFIILTKVTPGIGLLWFLTRREWRHLAIALGATLGVRRRIRGSSRPTCGASTSTALFTVPDTASVPSRGGSRSPRARRVGRARQTIAGP